MTFYRVVAEGIFKNCKTKVMCSFDRSKNKATPFVGRDGLFSIGPKGHAIECFEYQKHDLNIYVIKFYPDGEIERYEQCE